MPIISTSASKTVMRPGNRVFSGPLVGASFKGALDAIAANLYDIFCPGVRLVASYTGPTCRIRDNTTTTEYDLTPGATGFVTSAQVTALVGAHEFTLSRIYGQVTGLQLASAASAQPWGAFDANGILYGYSKADFTSYSYITGLSLALTNYSAFTVCTSTGYQFLALNLVDDGDAEAGITNYGNQLRFWANPTTGIADIGGTGTGLYSIVGNASSSGRITNGLAVGTTVGGVVSRTINSIRIGNGGGAAWWPNGSKFYASGFWNADIGATNADTAQAALKTTFYTL